MGDPSGIGPEIIAKAVKCPDVNRLADIVIIGDKNVFQKVSKYPLKKTQFIDLKNVPARNFAFGRIKQAYGKASVEYIQQAVILLKRKNIDCLVTCPI